MIQVYVDVAGSVVKGAAASLGEIKVIKPGVKRMPLWWHLVVVSWNVFLGDSYSVRFWVGAVKGHGFWWQDAAQASGVDSSP